MFSQPLNQFFTEDTYKTEYLTDPHFETLREMVQGRKCYVCETLYTILPHHITYKNLWHERLWRDIYPLCYDCHYQVHFIIIFKFIKIKVPLKRFFLRKRMFYLRIKYCVQNKKYISASWAGLLYLMT
jgi:hypothetical protein